MQKVALLARAKKSRLGERPGDVEIRRVIVTLRRQVRKVDGPALAKADGQDIR